MHKIAFPALFFLWILLGSALSTADEPYQVNPAELIIPRHIQAAFPYYLTCVDYHNSPVYIVEFGKWDLTPYCDSEYEDSEILEQLDNHVTVFIYWLLRDGLDHSTSPGSILIADIGGYKAAKCEKVKDFLMLQVKKFEEANRKPGLKAIYVVNAFEDAFKEYNYLLSHLGSLEGRMSVYGYDSETWPKEVLDFIHLRKKHNSKNISPLQEVLDINNVDESLRCNYQYYQLGYAKNGAPVFYGEFGGKSWNYHASIKKGHKGAKALEKYMCQMFLRINYEGEVAKGYPGAIFIANVKDFTGEQTEDFCTAGFLGKVNSFGVNIGRNHYVTSYVIGASRVYNNFAAVVRPLDGLGGRVRIFEEGTAEECKAELGKIVDPYILPPECGGPSPLKPLKTFGCGKDTEYGHSHKSSSSRDYY